MRQQIAEIYSVENQEHAQHKRGFVGRLLRFLIWTFVILLVLLGAATALLFVFEKDVKAAILTELNRHLQVKVKVAPENIDLSIIKSFPDCALRFKRVLVLDAFPEKTRDTLLSAEELSLRFNVKDLWSGQYRIHRIQAIEGALKLKVLKSGQNNYQFWKDSVSTGGSTSFDLDKIILQKFHLVYQNNQIKFLADLQVRDLEFSGHFKEENYDLACKGKMQVNELLQNKVSFLKSKNMELDLLLAVKDEDYQLQKADLQINDLHLNLNGRLKYGTKLEEINLGFEGNDLQIRSLLSLLPANYSGVVSDYESEGKMYLKGKYQYKNEFDYVLNCSFGISKATIKYKPNGTIAEDVNLEGLLKYDPSQSNLDLSNILLRLNEDVIKGSCNIRNFQSPLLAFQVEADLHLENLQKFWPIDTITELSGTLKLNANVVGRLDELRNNTFGNATDIKLEASIQNLITAFKGDDKKYSVSNCDLKAEGGEVHVKDLQLQRGSSDIQVNGRIPGLFSYLTDPNAALIISGNLISKVIHVEDFLPPGTAGSSDKPLIPAKVSFALNAQIGKFYFGKFEASEMTGDLEFKNQKALANEVKLQSMGGSAELNAFVDNSKGKIDLTMQVLIAGIDVKELFRQMNNFGQTTLIDEHLKGIASASIDLSGRWSNQLVFDEQSLVAHCKLEVEQGELKNFEPLKVLSKFVDVNELRDIRFSSLQSNIDISNRIITIPQTSIRNSALNIDVWGTHSFDNVMDYHIRLLISELLNKKRNKNQDQFGTLTDDPENRRMAFIRMTGTVDKPIIKYDREGLKQKVKTDIKAEKQNLRAILKEEFGLFKKDSVQKKAATKTVFEIEDSQAPQKQKPLEPKKKQEDEDF